MKSSRIYICDECDCTFDIDEGEAIPEKETGKWYCPGCHGELYAIELPSPATPGSLKGTMEITITVKEPRVTKKQLDEALKRNAMHFANATAGALLSGVDYDVTVTTEKVWDDGIVYFLNHEEVWKISRRNLKDLMTDLKAGSRSELVKYEAVRVCDSFWFDLDQLTESDIDEAIKDLGGNR